ncbi:hypothetical protein E2320_008683 [Naja naja]|nr:hypothetical protein E2320_008683 [Naja naja]
MALTLPSEGSVAEEAGGPAEEVEGKVAAAALLETPGCSGAGARDEQGSRSESSCGGNEELEDEEEVMEEGTARGGAAALFGGFGTEDSEMDCDEEDERMINLSELVPYIICIVRHFYYSNRCPKCNIVVHQTQPLYNIRLDRQLQDIVYKLVVNLEETVPQAMAVGRGRPRKVVGSVFRIPPELDMSLLLEFIGHWKKSLYVFQERQQLDTWKNSSEERWILILAVDIICGDHLLEQYQTLREIQNALGKSAVQDGLLILHYGLILSGDSTFSKIS